MEPDPQESEPLVESGAAEGGEATLGEADVSVTVRCGNGGKWIVEDAEAKTDGDCPETALGLTFG
jgi:hypothetical protein